VSIVCSRCKATKSASFAFREPAVSVTMSSAGRQALRFVSEEADFSAVEHGAAPLGHDLSIRCADPVLHERVNCPHRGGDENAVIAGKWTLRRQCDELQKRLGAGEKSG